MKKAEDVMRVFMEKLDNNVFDKHNQPNQGPELSDEFVQEQVASYQELLNTGIIRRVTRAE